MRTETRVDHLGHTTFRLSCAGQTILIDPVLVLPGLRFREHRTPEWWFPGGERIDAVFISHAHSDHLHPPSLLGLPRDTPVFAYETEAVNELEQLGFTRLTTLVADEAVRLDETLTVRVIPASASGEGTLQCAFLIETPDATVLDLVDAPDTERTRKALEPWRGSIDLAFVPTGASLQWQGYWNQMDTVRAAELSRWLGAATVAPCGGALSAHGPRALGLLERYPSDRADWYAVGAHAVGIERLIRWRTPFFLLYRNHELVRSGPLPQADFSNSAKLFETQALVATFFAGFDPRSSLQRLASESLELHVQAWAPARAAIGESGPLLGQLLERCHSSAHASPAARLAPRTLRRLCLDGETALAGRIAAVLPESASPFDLALSFFDVVEAVIRSAPRLAAEQRREVLTCLGLDRVMSALGREAVEMKRLSHLAPESADGLAREHVERLRADVDCRRPVLSANLLRIQRADIALLLDQPVSNEVASCLVVATPQGVRFVTLREDEDEILRQCDGRTVAEISDDMARQLGAEPETARAGLVELLMRLTRISIHLIDWSG